MFQNIALAKDEQPAQETWTLDVTYTLLGSYEESKAEINAHGSVTLRKDTEGTYRGTGDASLSWHVHWIVDANCRGHGPFTVSAQDAGRNLIVRIEHGTILCTWVPLPFDTEDLCPPIKEPGKPTPLVIEKRDGAVAEFHRTSGRYEVLPKFVLSGNVNWCEEAKRMGLDHNDAGGVICIKGQAIPCVWQQSAIPEIDGCAMEHERSHATDVDCPHVSSFETSLFPTRPTLPRSRAYESECIAYKKQLSCLQQKRVICSAPGVTTKDCEGHFDFFIGNTNAQFKSYRCH